MNNNIWGLLEAYEGRWVAVDRGGKIVAHATTLPEVMTSAGSAVRRLTFLYAAAQSRDTIGADAGVYSAA